MNDPILLTCIVAIAIHVAGTAIAFYLWNENRSERFLQFWTLSFSSGLVRWLMHYPAESNSRLRGIEVLFISAALFFMALGSYDVLPSKPWRQRTVVVTIGVVLLSYAVLANTTNITLVSGYLLFLPVLGFAGGCMWAAYRSTRLPGYAFAAGTLVYELVVVGLMLFTMGPQIGNNILIPLYLIPLMLSVVVIAYQRHRRQLSESERTLQKIFETAPTPIVIVRPPAGEVERANPVALEMLGITSDTAVGRTAVEHGLVQDATVRQRIYTDLAMGRRVHNQETTILRAGHDQRTVSVNADRIVLESGDRYIYSFYDLTELRRAEQELRASSEETRRLYMRLANVEEDERRVLHAELHDQVGANLSALRLSLDVAASMLSRNDAAGAERHLREAREVTGETIGIARDLMAELRPPSLDDFGLVAALRSFAEVQSSRLNLPIHVTGEDLHPRPTALVESSLFRIASEAVVNAARHASAMQVTIDIGARDGRLVLEIIDDGVGFDVAAPAAGPDHWGLRSMRERARAIGGVLHVNSEARKGTRITADVPREQT
jgi:PAS domain S-box-containing protein